MRRLIIAILAMALVVGFSIPASGADGSSLDCLNAPISEGRLTDTMDHRDDGQIRIGTVGSFLWVALNNTGPRGMILGDVQSYEISDDAVAVEACLDGTVTFTEGGVVSSSGVDGPTVQEVLFPVEVWLERLYHNFGPTY